MDPIYLDHNATTPVRPEVVEAMRPFWHTTFGNPASAHRAGQRARQALEGAREQVASLLDAHPDEVVFTSGATEANNLALFGLVRAPPGRVILSPVEHPSVYEPAAQFGKRGYEVRQLRVDHQGIVDEASLSEQLTDDTQLVAVMLVNNETGAVQPVGSLAPTVREGSPIGRRNPSLTVGTSHGDRSATIPFHCDAVQGVGKMQVRFHDLGVTTLSLSAHKFGGPRGIGALLVRKGTRLSPLFYGGAQQRGERPGTEPVALVIGLAKALEVAVQLLDQHLLHVRQLRTRLLEHLKKSAAPVVVNGSDDALPYTLNLSFPGCQAESLLVRFDLMGIICSTGSACSSGSLLPSPTLQAMGCPPDVLKSAMRFSFNPMQTMEEIDHAAGRIARCVRELREASAG